DFAGNPDETHGLADSRLQRFMRNALDDLTRPAPPAAFVATRTGRAVRLQQTGFPDQRLKAIRILRHGGARVFLPAARGGKLVCSTLAPTCVDRPPAGIYRYAAVSVDRWRASIPVYSNPVRVPRR